MRFSIKSWKQSNRAPKVAATIATNNRASLSLSLYPSACVYFWNDLSKIIHRQAIFVNDMSNNTFNKRHYHVHEQAINIIF